MIYPNSYIHQRAASWNLDSRLRSVASDRLIKGRSLWISHSNHQRGVNPKIIEFLESKSSMFFEIRKFDILRNLKIRCFLEHENSMFSLKTSNFWILKISNWRVPITEFSESENSTFFEIRKLYFFWNPKIWCFRSSKIQCFSESENSMFSESKNSMFFGIRKFNAFRNPKIRYFSESENSVFWNPKIRCFRNPKIQCFVVFENSVFFGIRKFNVFRNPKIRIFEWTLLWLA